MSLSCSGVTGRSLSCDAQAAQEKAFAHSCPWNQILRHTSAYRTLTLPVSRHVTSEQSKINGPAARCLGWVFRAPNKSPGYYMEERWVGKGLGISFHAFLTTRGPAHQRLRASILSRRWLFQYMKIRGHIRASATPGYSFSVSLCHQKCHFHFLLTVDGCSQASTGTNTPYDLDSEM